MHHEHVPVLIVGAGYAGLSAAASLAWRDVPVILAERHPSTSIQPKAFGVNWRAMELLRPIPGIEDQLASIAAKVGGDSMRMAIATSLRDPNPHILFDEEQAQDIAALARLTPARDAGAPQSEVERALRRKAEELGADLRFNTEVIALVQDPDGVTVTLRTLVSPVPSTPAPAPASASASASAQGSPTSTSRTTPADSAHPGDSASPASSGDWVSSGHSGDSASSASSGDSGNSASSASSGDSASPSSPFNPLSGASSPDSSSSAGEPSSPESASYVDTIVRADYVIAADGWRSPLRERLGVSTIGKGLLGRMRSIMFEADLTDLVRDREVTLWYLRNDTFTGVFITGTGVGAHVVGINFAEGQTEDDFTPEHCVELVRIATGTPDLDVRLLDHATFDLGHVLAEQYRAGRVFFAGDAAHTMPPTGGQGGSLALQDGCDIAWRLWLVLTGQAHPSFLDTYDAERRPIGEFTANAQLGNLGFRMPPALRVGYPEPVEDPVAAVLGLRVHSSAILAEPGDDLGLREDPRTPTARPGSRAPHLPLDWDGRAISTLDLFGAGFVLLAGPRGRDWAEAGRQVRDRLGVRLAPHLINDELVDVTGFWQHVYGVGPDGAVLVRPDGYIAWRSSEGVGDPAGVLEDVLGRILGRASVPAV
ncbi:FAD-dependent monooxygenase [Nonomuraea sp. NPDC050310]|uniref:FAD-dependent monooxygenase n=1 Tax=Nonomuraea sp. NPDC050310 TaxID=3154935 RepID=UPI0033CD50FD